jgi:hypothetical protein
MARRRFQCGRIVFHILVTSRGSLALGEQQRTQGCREQQSNRTEFPKQAERFFHDSRRGRFTLTKNTSLFRNEKDEDESDSDTDRTRGAKDLLESIERRSQDSDPPVIDWMEKGAVRPRLSAFDPIDGGSTGMLRPDLLR